MSAFEKAMTKARAYAQAKKMEQEREAQQIWRSHKFGLTRSSKDGQTVLYY